MASVPASLILALSAGLVVGLGCSPQRDPFDTGTPVDAVAGDNGSADVVTPVDGGGEHCNTQAECDDHLDCTADQCVIGNVCQHTSTCAGGMFCSAHGCTTMMSCMNNGQCDDHVACTTDLCVAGGVCQHLRDDSRCDASEMCSIVSGCLAMGHCMIAGDCDDGRYCNGVETCTGGMCHAGTAIPCDDMNACTADSCNDSTRMCVHMPLDPCAMVSPGMFDLAPAPAYSCMSGSMDASTVTLGVTTTSVSVMGFSVNGAPVTLRGGAPMMSMFDATGTLTNGGCRWTVNLHGSFMSATHFTGSWTVSLDNCFGGSGDCFGGSGLCDGTLTH